MKEKLVNSFLTPARLVWEKELGQPLELASAQVVSNQFTTDDLTAVIGISGRLEGNVLYGFSAQTTQSIVNVMLGEASADVSSEMGLSAIGEIANVITGNAATKLAEMGYRCDISPPVIIGPVGTRLTTIGESQILVNFTSSIGALSVRISLYEKRD
jgi:chemotaxis protein CheX